MGLRKFASKDSLNSNDNLFKSSKGSFISSAITNEEHTKIMKTNNLITYYTRVWITLDISETKFEDLFKFKLYISSLYNILPIQGWSFDNKDS